jgi:long-chain acyl-CoA synthetase
MNPAFDSTLPQIPLVDAATPSSTPREDLLAAWDRTCRAYDERIALRIREPDGWRTLSYAELRAQAHRLAGWLMENGVTRGTPVALLSESRPEWAVALFGSLLGGATAVPLDPKLGLEELTVLANHCPPALLLASRALMTTALALKARVPGIERVLILDGDGDEGEVVWLRRALPRAAHAPAPRRAGETALVVYTSGTTGNAKGVEITFGNLQFQGGAVDRAFDLRAGERFLSVLPLNHLY